MPKSALKKKLLNFKKAWKNSYETGVTPPGIFSPRNQKNYVFKCPNLKRASKKAYKTCVTPLNMFLKNVLKSEGFPKKKAPECQEMQFKKKYFQIWKELEKFIWNICLTHLLEYFFPKNQKFWIFLKKGAPEGKQIYIYIFFKC